MFLRLQIVVGWRMLKNKNLKLKKKSLSPTCRQMAIYSNKSFSSLHPVYKRLHIFCFLPPIPLPPPIRAYPFDQIFKTQKWIQRQP
jgi:hypothetical protein